MIIDHLLSTLLLQSVHVRVRSSNTRTSSSRTSSIKYSLEKNWMTRGVEIMLSTNTTIEIIQKIPTSFPTYSTNHTLYVPMFPVQLIYPYTLYLLVCIHARKRVHVIVNILKNSMSFFGSKTTTSVLSATEYNKCTCLLWQFYNRKNQKVQKQ